MNRQSRISSMLKRNPGKTAAKWLSLAATDLQHAIRAEAGLYVGNVKCVVDGKIATVHSPLGQVVCVTCGKVMPWSASGTHAGHFASGRSHGVVLEEHGIFPQCYRCNEILSGNVAAYTIFMLDQYGQDVVDDLRRRANNWTLGMEGERVEIFPHTIERLAGLRVDYRDRSAAAELAMGRSCGQPSQPSSERKSHASNQDPKKEGHKESRKKEESRKGASNGLERVPSAAANDPVRLRSRRASSRNA